MNAVLAYLEANRRRLELDRHGLPGPPSFLLVTPRFRASSHVVFLILPRGGAAPVLAAKLPRLPQGRANVAREVEKLRAVHARRPGGFESIPRVVGFEEWRGLPIFLQTALVGSALDRRTVARDPKRACDLGLAWLAEVHGAGDRDPAGDPHWFEDLAVAPLRTLAERLPLSLEETAALAETRDRVAPLARPGLPRVFEHGDLSHPNLLRLHGGGLGVLDWELADPRGLPAQDLFFFLTYVAFARERVRDAADHLRAFDAAFFGARAWARPFVRAYAEALRIPAELLSPLFLLAWLRHLARLVERLAAPTAGGPLAPDTVRWLRENRYYALWRHTLRGLDRLDWGDLPRGAPAGSR